MPTAVRHGVRIHFEVAGDGAPLLLHGGGPGDLRMWRHAGYVDGLNDHRLILIDPRGHGLSSRPRGAAAYAIGEFAADVLAVLDAAEVDRCTVWGHGDGARVALELAADAPGRVGAVIAAGAVDEPPAIRRQAAQGVRRLGMTALVRLLQREEALEVPDWLWLQFAETDADVLALELEAWAAWPGPWALADRVRCPVLCLAGAHEDPGGELTALAARLPDGEAALLDGVGHLGAFLAAPRALAAVRPFLVRVAGR
jgi:pimeloyl-ACP methyl ester carboxylesterase